MSKIFSKERHFGRRGSHPFTLLPCVRHWSSPQMSRLDDFGFDQNICRPHCVRGHVMNYFSLVLFLEFAWSSLSVRIYKIGDHTALDANTTHVARVGFIGLLPLWNNTINKTIGNFSSRNIFRYVIYNGTNYTHRPSSTNINGQNMFQYENYKCIVTSAGLRVERGPG